MERSGGCLETGTVLTQKCGDDLWAIGANIANISAGCILELISQVERQVLIQEVRRSQVEQGGDDWDVLKRRVWSNVHLIVHFYAKTLITTYF